MSTSRALLYVLQRLALLVGMCLLMAPLWPLYGLVRLFRPRPPILPSARRTLGTLGLILTVKAPEPGLRPLARLSLAIELLNRWAPTPAAGLAWALDDLLYGRALAQTEIHAPLFELSAARSGSTQLAHYLEDDPQIAAPNTLQGLFPYLWLWRLVPHAPAWLMTREKLGQKLLDLMPKEYLERHEMDAWRTDTFEMLYLNHKQYGDVLFCLGPDLLIRELSPAVVRPGTEEVWADFLRFIDAIGRKTLLYRGPQPDGRPRRLMIKGHFLNVASELERRYPDARFLTVIRTPEKRMQSVINFHHVQPTDPVCGFLPFPWVTALALASEPLYCEREMAWFQQTGGAHRTVVRFDDYVRDLEGTMRLVYRSCLDLDALSPHVPTVHAARVRSNYTHDRSLEELGIDVAALRARLAPYIAWCKPAAKA